MDAPASALLECKLVGPERQLHSAEHCHSAEDAALVPSTQQLLTIVPWDPVLSSGLCEHCTYVCCTGKPLIYTQ